MNKTTIIATLRKFIAQRPGLEFGNYGDVSAYRSELRSITKDGSQAKTLLRFIELHDSITADMILEAAKHSFSGRLSLVIDGDKVSIDYCKGQYWPTEYRRAVCSVLSSAIWNWLSVDCNYSTGDEIRKQAAREFGRGIANRWFN